MVKSVAKIESSERYTVTAALPYANGPLHIGHVAGCYLPADIYVRHLKSIGKDVLFVCGSDEHGAAITVRAKKENTTPKKIVDENHRLIKDTFIKFGIGFDIYHRTSSDLHHETARNFFLELYEKKSLIEKETEQFYDAENDQFLADRYIVGTCPNCSFDKAYGDQCEKCGSTLSPNELIQPKSTISGNRPVLKKTKHWFLPLDQHEEWLRKWIEEGKLNGAKQHDASKWRKQVIGQCKSWIDNGLLPRSITRDLDWGIQIPIAGNEGKVLYVWFDAPIGYISATKEWAKSKNINWENYWKDDNTKLIHFIGKDNIVFHAIIFPIILKEYGGYILPSNVPANEFLNLEGDKISTSRNWAVWLHEYLEDFPEKEDELRYVLTSIAPETKDSEFTWKDYQARVNNELVAILGNFINRTVVLTHKYFGGSVPVSDSLGDMETKVLDSIKITEDKVSSLIHDFKIREAQNEAMNLARLGNKYLAETEPWKLIGTNENRVKTILNTSIQISQALSLILAPFLPKTCNKLKRILNSDGYGILPSDHIIGEGELLFQKIEDASIKSQIDKLHKTKSNQSNPKARPMKDEVTFDDFTKMDIRVATIKTAEKHPNADKLLKLTLDTGIDERTVVSGIADYYQPEDIVGKQVSVLINLAPRKIRGIESQGMILMAEDNNGELAFVSPEKAMHEGGEIR